MSGKRPPEFPGSDEIATENKLLRKMLWETHPCLGKYGDDGELQCGACLIDFKRDSAEQIHARVMERGLKKLMAETQVWPEWSETDSLEERVRRLEQKKSETDLDHIRLGPRRESEDERNQRVQETADRIVDHVTKVLRNERTSMVRAKFVCSFVDVVNKTVHMSPVYTGSEENKQFFAATPGGVITLYCLNEMALSKFETGKEYYVDFNPAVTPAVSSSAS